MAKFTAIVVVYNKSILRCPVANALSGKNIDVILFDNSDSEFENRTAAKTLGWAYLGGAGNAGLSKAYNACIDFIKEKDENRFVCLFDQDSEPSENYFELLSMSIDAPCKIYAPLVYSGEKLISPSRIKKLHRMKLFKKVSDALSCDDKKISAVNSGMAIGLSVFENYRYDENIFLDGIDHEFIAQMKARGEEIRVFPAKIAHRFSADEKPDFEAALARFKGFKKDFKYIMRNRRLTYAFLVGKRSLRLCWQYKTVKFLVRG